MRPKPVVLCILDGWGHREDAPDNAIACAHTPHWDRMLKTYSHTQIATSGLDVGLPEGQMGNSEVGHMNIGSGRVVMQDLPRIDAAIKDGSLAKHPELKHWIENIKKSGGKAHLMGLLSDGGVHAHIHHIMALAEIIAKAGIDVNIHAFTDGRDTAPGSAVKFVKMLEDRIQKTGIKDRCRIATVSGRYYAMDRDNRWERVEAAYHAMAGGKAPNFTSAIEGIEASFKTGKNDEFILPFVVGNYQGMNDGDGLLMANFRADRARQILEAFLNKDFSGFKRSKTIKFSGALGMVEYSEVHNKWLKTIFLPEKLTRIFGEIISEAGLTQLRIAETEKYAHVTFFFNGGLEKEFKGEERIMIPSPKIATYDLQPEMSAAEVTKKMVEAIESGRFDVIIANFANTDMVGHSGIQAAAEKAVEAVDTALGQLEAAVLKHGGVMAITADHGNAEMMRDPETHEPHTAHTLLPVPFVWIADTNPALRNGGRLADIAPTLLQILGIKIPDEMTGKSLLV